MADDFHRVNAEGHVIFNFRSRALKLHASAVRSQRLIGFVVILAHHFAHPLVMVRQTVWKRIFRKIQHKTAAF